MSRPQHELYKEQRSLDQYDAVDFFDFCGFSSDQRQNAVFVWKTIILPQVLQRDSAQYKRLNTTWSHSKRARQKYWNDKQKKEERDAQLDDHIEHIRNDTIKQTQLVSGSITRDVGERLKAISPSLSVGSDTWKHGSHSTISLKSNSVSIPASVDSEATAHPDPSVSPASAPRTPTSSTTKKSRITYKTEEPWRELTLSLTKIVNGDKDIRFPAPLPSMKPIHAQLFQHAVESMQEYLAQDPLEKDITLLKDAQVAMSCVLNTMSANACEHFEESDHEDVLDQARSLSFIAGFDQHLSTTFMKDYATCLEEEGVGALRKKLIRRWNILNNVEHSDGKVLSKQAVIEDKVIEILILLCHFVHRSPFGSKAPSESDCLHLWTSIFYIIANKVTLHTKRSSTSGEKVLEASKLMKQMQSIEYGDVSDSGRKVDCIFMYEDIELSNIEFKNEDSSERELGLQNRKNVRLARCLQEAHAAIGVKDPSVFMADVYGFVGVFYQVKPMGDIAIAGRTTTSAVHLPQSVGGLTAFLQGDSLAIIWNFIEHLEEQGPKIKRAKECYEVEQDKAKLARGLTNRRASSPASQERNFGSYILLTPTKKRRKESVHANNLHNE